MARVLKGSHSFTCTPRVHPLTEWTIPAFAFPAEAGTHLPTPEGWTAELAGTRCAYALRDGQAELTRVAGWLNLDMNVWHWELNTGMVTHPSTNRAQRTGMLTSLIETKALLLHQTTTMRQSNTSTDCNCVSNAANQSLPKLDGLNLQACLGLFFYFLLQKFQSGQSLPNVNVESTPNFINVANVRILSRWNIYALFSKTCRLRPYHTPGPCRKTSVLPSKPLICPPQKIMRAPVVTIKEKILSLTNKRYLTLNCSDSLWIRWCIR